MLIEVLREDPDVLTLQALASRVLANPRSLTGGVALARAIRVLDDEGLVFSNRPPGAGKPTGAVLQTSGRLSRRRPAGVGEMTKIMTVRIEDDLNDEINAVARADEAPASEVVRAALHHYIAARRSDPQFQTRLRELLEKDTEVVGRLAAGLAA